MEINKVNIPDLLARPETRIMAGAARDALLTAGATAVTRLACSTSPIAAGVASAVSSALQGFTVYGYRKLQGTPVAQPYLATIEAKLPSWALSVSKVAMEIASSVIGVQAAQIIGYGDFGYLSLAAAMATGKLISEVSVAALNDFQRRTEPEDSFSQTPAITLFFKKGTTRGVDDMMQLTEILQSNGGVV
ncbi:MAG: hypothetical protein KDK78_10850, partial [Chlamydiia bacterium]|nr:hypothetical protein [Chlamydiia bacterium]